MKVALYDAQAMPAIMVSSTCCKTTSSLATPSPAKPVSLLLPIDDQLVLVDDPIGNFHLPLVLQPLQRGRHQLGGNNRSTDKLILGNITK